MSRWTKRVNDMVQRVVMENSVKVNRTNKLALRDFNDMALADACQKKSCVFVGVHNMKPYFIPSLRFTTSS
jgi:hypothetical protein